MIQQAKGRERDQQIKFIISQIQKVDKESLLSKKGQNEEKEKAKKLKKDKAKSAQQQEEE